VRQQIKHEKKQRRRHVEKQQLSGFEQVPHGILQALPPSDSRTGCTSALGSFVEYSISQSN
jgi:hypothetical protein